MNPLLEQPKSTPSEDQFLQSRNIGKVNSWFRNCCEKLRSIALLVDNWDSYGARCPDSVALTYASSFLDLIRRRPGLPEPSITPSPNGNVCFEWECHGIVLVIEINAKGTGRYYFECGDIEDEGVEDYSRLLPKLNKLAVNE